VILSGAAGARRGSEFLQISIRALLFAGASTLFLGAALAQTPSLNDLVEDALRRHQPGAEAPPAEEPWPLLPNAAAPVPDAVAPTPAAPPATVAAPKPYTPPTIADPARPPPAREGGEAQAPADAAPGAATAEPVAPGTERELASLTAEEINAATYVEGADALPGANPLVAKLQVRLDRAGASPGVIDAYAGANVRKAVEAVETVLGLPVDGMLDQQVWDALGGDSAAPVVVQYTITDEDAAYPFLSSIPADYSEQAQLPTLGFTSPEERFGERFHMNPKLLAALNPGADFRKVGATIWVAAFEGQPVTGAIARIVADKTRRQVRAYDAGNRLIVAYPATIGSDENPSPTGDHVVEGVAANPVYYYDPGNFVQAGNTEKLELPPGPNNPVGTMWIDLSEPSYGIHGTPEPSKIDKTGSHGCIRLTNWDAEELAGLVQPGVIVSFLE